MKCHVWEYSLAKSVLRIHRGYTVLVIFILLIMDLLYFLNIEENKSPPRFNCPSHFPVNANWPFCISPVPWVHQKLSCCYFLSLFWQVLWFGVICPCSLIFWFCGDSCQPSFVVNVVQGILVLISSFSICF